MNRLSWSNINLQTIPKDILPEVVTQINKDFDEQSVINVSNDYLMDDLIESLENYLLDLNRKGTDLQNLLYRIDVPEKYAIAVFQISDLTLLTIELAHLILKREVQKVLIRRHFRDSI